MTDREKDSLSVQADSPHSLQPANPATSIQNAAKQFPLCLMQEFYRVIT
jgi:hypothetical protein